MPEEPEEIEPKTGYNCSLNTYHFGGTLNCIPTDIDTAQYPTLESCQRNCVNTRYIERPLLYNYPPGYWGWFGRRRRPIWPPRFPHRRRHGPPRGPPRGGGGGPPRDPPRGGGGGPPRGPPRGGGGPRAGK